MKWIFVLLGLLPCFLFAQKAENVGDVAAVTVVASTTFGEPLGKALVLLRPVGPLGEFRRVGNTVRFDHVPFGRYDLEIQSPGFGTRRERLEIYQSELHVWFGLAVSPPHSEERDEIVGFVARPESDQRDIWVRLVPQFSSDFVEDHVKAGTFHLTGVHPGLYFVLLFDKDDLILTKRLEYVGGKATLNLNLLK